MTFRDVLGWWGMLVALAVVAILVGWMATASRAQGRIELTAVPIRVIEPGPPVGRSGDMERVRWSLRDRSGRNVGRAIYSCRWHREQERLCSGEMKLPLGTLVVSGSSPTRGEGLWAVTGGTGRYKGTGGELYWRAIGLHKLAVTITL